MDKDPGLPWGRALHGWSKRWERDRPFPSALLQGGCRLPESKQEADSGGGQGARGSLLTPEAASSEVGHGAGLWGSAAVGLTQQGPLACTGALLGAVVSYKAVTQLEGRKRRQETV